jgi:hypothetical protein
LSSRKQNTTAAFGCGRISKSPSPTTSTASSVSFLLQFRPSERQWPAVVENREPINTSRTAYISIWPFVVAQKEPAVRQQLLHQPHNSSSNSLYNKINDNTNNTNNKHATCNRQPSLRQYPRFSKPNTHFPVNATTTGRNAFLRTTQNLEGRVFSTAWSNATSSSQDRNVARTQPIMQVTIFLFFAHKATKRKPNHGRNLRALKNHGARRQTHTQGDRLKSNCAVVREESTLAFLLLTSGHQPARGLVLPAYLLTLDLLLLLFFAVLTVLQKISWVKSFLSNS